MDCNMAFEPWTAEIALCPKLHPATATNGACTNKLVKGHKPHRGVATQETVLLAYTHQKENVNPPFQLSVQPAGGHEQPD